MRENFSGFLICSDYDGTFAQWGVVPPANLIAVKEYMRRGGKFTFCTGRSWNAAAQGYPIIPNAPMVALSGGQIGDVEQGRMLEGYPMEEKLLSDLKRLTRSYAAKEIEICFENRAVSIAADDFSCRLAEPVYKVVIFTESETVTERDKIAALCENRYEVSFNGPCSVELTARGYNKGTGALRVKELTGAKTLVGIGDYQGDLSLREAADIFAAPKDSWIGKKASLSVAAASEGALADLIERL